MNVCDKMHSQCSFISVVLVARALCTVSWSTYDNSVVVTIHGQAIVVQDPNLPQGEKLYLTREKVRAAFALTGETQQSLITDHRDWSSVADRCVIITSMH